MSSTKKEAIVIIVAGLLFCASAWHAHRTKRVRMGTWRSWDVTEEKNPGGYTLALAGIVFLAGFTMLIGVVRLLGD